MYRQGGPASACGQLGWETLASNSFGAISKDRRVAAIIRTISAQRTADAVRTQFDAVADLLGRKFQTVRTVLLGAKEDLTAFAFFPKRHWKCGPGGDGAPQSSAVRTAWQRRQLPHAQLAAAFASVGPGWG
ncbi:transposase [Kitasatospora sp. NPDC096128]|uniref:transposase n=1 Tax=Kitasatospora sp. NPDC096128 TaxID=3155547 RepID=UPI00331B7B06